MADQKPTYLALGDSYTIGEGVEVHERWPILLAERLGWQKPDIIANTGWKTFELLDALQTAELQNNYDWVSLLIGVNNQYRQIAFSDFQRDLQKLANFMLSRVPGPEHIFLVSIPDYSVTPFAQDQDTRKITAELEQYNIYKRQFALEKGFQFCNITDLSMYAADDHTLLVDDQLHPSALQYRLWVDRIVQNCRFDSVASEKS